MKHLEGRLMELRLELEKNITDDDTKNLRGRIQEIKALMALDKPEPDK
jgi:hypothetical protein